MTNYRIVCTQKKNSQTFSTVFNLKTTLTAIHYFTDNVIENFEWGLTPTALFCDLS